MSFAASRSASSPNVVSRMSPWRRSAEAANVFAADLLNYFPSKEAALFGADPELATATRDAI